MKNLGLMYPLGLTVKLLNFIHNRIKEMMAILKEDNFMRMEVGIKMQVLPETGCLHWHCGVSQRTGPSAGPGKFLPLLDKYFQILLTGFVVAEY